MTTCRRCATSGCGASASGRRTGSPARQTRARLRFDELSRTTTVTATSLWRTASAPSAARTSRPGSARDCHRADSSAAGLRLDGPHLSPAQAPRDVALLRHGRHRTRLPRRTGSRLPAGDAGREDARHLEPVAVLRHRHAPTTSCTTSARCKSSTWPPAGKLPSVSWVIPTGKVSEHPRPRWRTGRPTSPA